MQRKVLARTFLGARTPRGEHDSTIEVLGNYVYRWTRICTHVTHCRYAAYTRCRDLSCKEFDESFSGYPTLNLFGFLGRFEVLTPVSG